MTLPVWAKKLAIGNASVWISKWLVDHGWLLPGERGNFMALVKMVVAGFYDLDHPKAQPTYAPKPSESVESKKYSVPYAPTRVKAH